MVYKHMNLETGILEQAMRLNKAHGFSTKSLQWARSVSANFEFSSEHLACLQLVAELGLQGLRRRSEAIGALGALLGAKL